MRTFLHEMQQIDVVIQQFLEHYGYLVYILLFAIIYCKTAFVVLTFLPGDTTAFVSGAFVALGELNVWILLPLLFVATVLGDTQNYFIGRLGKRMTKRWVLIPESKIQSAQQFFERYGPRAIVFARFIPLMRTTIPFVTGYMRYPTKQFITLNSIGGAGWVVLWIGAGLLLGQIPVVKEHMTVSLSIISLLPFLLPLRFYCMRAIKRIRVST